MARTVDINNLDSEIKKLLEEYSSEIKQGLQDEAIKVGNIATRRLKATSPHRTGAYAGDWRVKKQKGGATVYNRKHYMLTHLLEKKHEIANQYGSYGEWHPDHEHIKPVEEEAKQEYMKRIRRIIKGT